MNKKLRLLLPLLILALPFIFIFSVKADAGWDTDYDSGGWSSGGSWDSGSSWGSSSSSYSSSGEGDPIFIIVAVIVVIVILAVSSKDNKNTAQNGKYYEDITEETIKTYLPEHDLGSLKHMAFQTFLSVQEAWMNFDFDTLKKICTDELYNSYKSDLNVLKLKNGQNIMSDFQKQNIRIVNILCVGQIVTVKVYLSVDFFDYVINQKTGEVTRGNKNRKVHNEYLLEFVRDIKGEEQITNCPNCGAEIKENVSDTCEFCRSKIVKKPKEFVLSKKNKIR